MQLLPVFSFFLGVHSLAIEQRSCVPSDVIAVAQQVTNPHYFCAWYLSDGRTRSPLQNVNTNALLTACKCITSVEPAGANAKNLDAIAKAARLQSFVSATCSSTSGSPVSKEFKNPSSFCSFFNSFERHDSPIPKLNVPAVRHACKCVLDSPVISTKKSSTNPVSTSTKKSSSKPSSSKRTVSKSSSTLSTNPNSKATVKTSSSKTSTIKPSSSRISSSRISSSRISSSRLSSSSKAITSKTSSKISSSKTTTSTKISSSTGSSSKASSSKTSSSKTSSSRMTTSKTSSVQSTSTLDAYNVITSEHLEAFCTTYLDYTIPSATLTVTAFATITKMNNFTQSTTFTAMSTSTETNIVAVTMSVYEYMDKRSMAIPTALAAYPNDVISSGCSRVVKLPVTHTISKTITLTSDVSIDATTTVTRYETDVSIATEVATSTTTAYLPVYTGTPCEDQPYGAIWQGWNGHYNLYCEGYEVVGDLVNSKASGNMADCLNRCQDISCYAVTFWDEACYLYMGNVTLKAASGYSAAIRVH